MQDWFEDAVQDMHNDLREVGLSLRAASVVRGNAREILLERAANFVVSAYINKLYAIELAEAF